MVCRNGHNRSFSINNNETTFFSRGPDAVNWLLPTSRELNRFLGVSFYILNADHAVSSVTPDCDAD